MITREIKFRAWIGSRTKKMVDVHKIEWNKYLAYISEKTFVHINDRKYYSDMILMQYTGLLDKNEKEIFEGDIVKLKSGLIRIEHPIVVKWQDYNAGFELPNCGYVGGWPPKEEMEIIGNIYENSNLIS